MITVDHIGWNNGSSLLGNPSVISDTLELNAGFLLGNHPVVSRRQSYKHISLKSSYLIYGFISFELSKSILYIPEKQ